MHKLKRGIYRWFVDASKICNGMGIGIWREGRRGDKAIGIGTSPSIFQAKIIAIQTCVEVIFKLLRVKVDQ